jgi:hypothetical protein
MAGSASSRVSNHETARSFETRRKSGILRTGMLGYDP